LAIVVAITMAIFVTGPADGATDETWDGRNGVAVLDLRNGRELWTARPSDDLVGYFGAAPGHDIVVASEGQCEESFYSRRLVAFGAASGRRRWQIDGAGYPLRSTHQLATYFSAVVPVDAQGIVVASTDEALTGYRADDGGVAWSKSAAADSPQGVSDDLVFTTTRQQDPVDSFRALERRTGRVRWESQVWSDQFDIIAASKRYVVVATGGLSSQPYLGPVTLVVLDALTGREEGRFDAGTPKVFSFNDIAIENDLLVYADGSSIVGRQLPNGERDWHRRFTKSALQGVARSTDDATVFALGAEAQAGVTALDAVTGRERWTRRRDEFRTAGSTAAVFGESSGRTLSGVDVDTGARRWRYEIPSTLTPPGIGAGDVTVETAGGRVAISNPCDTG
jgi:outer membrane protein assembly factor BamB